MAAPVPFFQRLSVRVAGMILLLGFVTLPIVSEVKRHAMERAVLQQTEIQAATATIAVVDGIQDQLRSAESTVRLLARELENHPLTAADAETLLRDVLASNRSVTECGIAFEPDAFDPAVARFGRYAHRGRDGLVLRDLVATGSQYWTKPWYRDALARGDAHWSEPFLDQGGADTEVVRVSAPFYRQVDGRRIAAGVVSTGVDLKWLNDVARSYDFFDTGYVIIFSAEGRILAHPRPQFVFRETMESLAAKFEEPQLALMHERVLGRRQGALSYASPSFHERVHANYKPAQVAGWGVVVGYAESEFLQPVNAIRTQTLIALAATLVLLAVIVLVVAQLRLRPLAALTRASDEIGKGNLDQAVPTSARDDELGRLAKSFEVMREVLKANRVLELQVKEHAAELERTNAQLRAELLERRWGNQALEHQLRYNQLIIDSISEAVFVLTKALNISRINPAVVHLTGFEAADLVNQPLSDLVELEVTAPHLTDPLGRALKEGHDLREQSALARDRRGGQVPVVLSLFPLRDKDKVVGGIAILRAAGPRRPELS